MECRSDDVKNYIALPPEPRYNEGKPILSGKTVNLLGCQYEIVV